MQRETWGRILTWVNKKRRHTLNLRVDDDDDEGDE